MKCGCPLHHEDAPCEKKIYWEVMIEFPDGKGDSTYSCVRCLSAVASSMLSGITAVLTLREAA